MDYFIEIYSKICYNKYEICILALPNLNLLCDIIKKTSKEELMNIKTKKVLIDTLFTLVILSVSFGISILFQKFDIWEQITTIFAFSVFLISLVT